MAGSIIGRGVGSRDHASTQGSHYGGHLHAHAQCPLQVDQAYSAALEGSTTAQPRALHAAAGPCGIGRERRSLRGDARRSARRLWGPRREVSPRRLGSALAGWPGNAVLHAFSRSPPSRAGVYARASARIPVAERGGVRDLELGKAVERVRVDWRPRLRFLRNRSRAQAARGWAAMVETSRPSNLSQVLVKPIQGFLDELVARKIVAGVVEKMFFLGAIVA